MNDDTDWSLFRFPPRPPKKWSGDDTSTENLVLAPSWAAPPVAINSWHFEDEAIMVVHPVLRKKIDLKRIITKRRLVKLCDLIKAQKNPIDAQALYLAIDNACSLMFGMSLPEMLAFGPNEWSWPEKGQDLEQDPLEQHDVQDPATQEPSSDKSKPQEDSLKFEKDHDSILSSVKP